MHNRPHGFNPVGPSLSRVDMILELIDKALADCAPGFLQVRTSVKNRPEPR